MTAIVAPSSTSCRSFLTCTPGSAEMMAPSGEELLEGCEGLRDEHRVVAPHRRRDGGADRRALGVNCSWAAPWTIFTPAVYRPAT
jgi:hypothetical protein